MQNFVHAFQKLHKFALCSLVVGALAACGGGGGSSPTTDAGSNPTDGGTPAAQVTQVQVVPALGAFSQGAIVSAYSPTGTLLASGVTDANGRVTALEIPASHTGAVLLKVRGAAGVTYFDEGTGTAQAFGAGDSLLSVIPADRVTAGTAFGVTPLTNMLAALAGVDADSPAPRLSAANPDQEIALAEKALKVLVPIPLDFLAAPIPFKSAADMNAAKAATDDGAIYGALLAELAKSSAYGSALDQAKSLATQTAAARAKTGAAEFDSAFSSVSSAVFSAADQLDSSPLLSGDKSKVNKVAAARTAAVTGSEYFAAKNNLDALKTLEEAVTADVNTKAALAVSFPIADLQGVYRNVGNTLRVVANADGTFLTLDTRAPEASVYVGRIEATSQGYRVSGRVISGAIDAFVSDTFASVALVSNDDGTITLTLDTDVELSRDEAYDTGLARADLTGDWSTILSGLNKVDWTISSTGLISGTSSTGCDWEGKVRLRNEGKALANVAVKESCVDGTVTEFEGVLSFANGDTSGNLAVTLLNLARSRYALMSLQAAQ